MKHVLTYFLCLTFVACSGSLENTEEHALSESEFNVELITKGNGNRRSYIFYMLGNQNTATQDVETFGTYMDLVEGKPLYPVEVNDQGIPVNDSEDLDDLYDSSRGLRAPNGGYKMFIASPAIKMSSPGQGSGIKGYQYARNEEGVYVSDPVDVTLGGVFLSDAKGSAYIYDASSQILRQPRSRLKLKFACGTDIEKTTLRSINLKNFIAEGYYIPVERRFHYVEQDIEEEEQLYPIEKSGSLTLLRGQVEDLRVDEYILSMNYGELDAEGRPRYPMPSLEIETGESDTDVVIFTAALGWDFRPQHAYEFTITINSVYINMTVTVIPWSENENLDFEVDDTDIWQINFPINDNGGVVNLLDWEKVAKQTGTIG